jgi:hypothetical protein
LLNQDELKKSLQERLYPRAKKTPKSSPFAQGFGRGLKEKRTMKGSSIHPPPNPKEKGLEIALRKSPRKGSENHQKGRNVKDTSKPCGTTPNHLYIPKRFIQGLACRPIILHSYKISP